MGFFPPIRRSAAMMPTANCKPLCRSLIPIWAWRRGIQAFFTHTLYPAPFYSVSAFLLGPYCSAVSIRHSDFRFSVYSYDFLFSFHRASFVKPVFRAHINETSVSELTHTGIQWHRPLISQATSVNNLTWLNILRNCFIKHYIPWQKGTLVVVQHRPP
jgi:hypothetical protein